MVIFFLIVALPKEPGSLLGEIGLTVDSVLRMVMGTQMGQCPFLRRSAVMTTFSDIQYPIQLAVCDPSDTQAGCTLANCGSATEQDVYVSGAFYLKVPVGGQDRNCRLDDFIDFENPETLLRCDSLVAGSCSEDETASASCGTEGNQVNVCIKCTQRDGPCLCFDEAENKYVYCNLKDFVSQELLSPEASQEHDLMVLMGREIPFWVCLVMFGIAPFFLIYYFSQDLLSATILKSDTRNALAITMAMVGVFTGAFMGITVAIVKFTRLSTNLGTLMLLIGMGVLVAFMMLVSSFGKTALSAAGTWEKVHYGIETLKQVGAAVVRERRPKNP